mmetsp:Transcript_35679/g.111327  ORF Transcript_35679/g.111327 Transcript_35679/m.111327 type:complete len:557 (+) Transcript_35679:63-1733(+)
MAKGGEASAKVLRGVQFPPGAGGARNSTEAVKEALAASTAAADTVAGERVRSERNWRYGYSRHLVKNCELLGVGPPGQEVAVASAGLQALRSSFEFVGADGAAVPLDRAMGRVPGLLPSHGGFDCGVAVGARAAEAPGPLRVPYGGRLLEGGKLCAQLQQWEARGIIEADAGGAIGRLADQCAVDLSGQHFACIGAGSEMGPASTLLDLGATVYAVDMPRPDVWRRLLRTAVASRGTLVAPIRRGGGDGEAPRARVVGRGVDEEEFCRAAGCNILEETPEVAAWVCSQAQGQRLCVGSYVYLDGANFVRVALAADAVIEALCTARPDVCLACLSSPTECYVVPQAAWDGAAERLSAPPAGSVHRLWYAPLRLASRGRYCTPAAPAVTLDSSAGPLRLRDSYVWMQGPNYAFAKQIQRWRVLLARSRGHTASSNLGPMTLTRSILSNALIGAGVKGATHFGLEPFYAATSSALLAALLVHDLSCETSAANPKVPLASPLLLFSENALHVGSWRAAFETNSYTEVCALTYGAGKAQPYVSAGAVAAAGLAALRLRAKL